MHLQSVKARLIGSYLFLVLLFVIQIPIIYMIIGGMGYKYAQEDVAGSLRMRAIELAEILNRHILTGDASLDAVFEVKVAEYDRVIETLKSGAGNIAPIKDTDLLTKLKKLADRWSEVKTIFNVGMLHGDTLTESRKVLRESTFPLVDRINSVISAEKALNDPEILQYVDVTGLQRMRTVKLSYLLERYFIMYDDKTAIADEIKETVLNFESTLADLKVLALGAASKGVEGERFKDAVEAVERVWTIRKQHMVTVMLASDDYRTVSLMLSSGYIPELVAEADELTKMFIYKAQQSGLHGVQLMTLAALLSAVIVAFFMWCTKVMIIKPLTKLRSTVEQFADGDLSKRSNIEVRLLGKSFNDEVTSLGLSVDRMADQMSGAIDKIVSSENKYRLIHDTAFDGIVITDTDSTILEFNRSTMNIFGYEDDELKSMKLAELIPLNCRDQYLDKVQRSCEPGIEVVSGEVFQFEGLRKNGDTFPLELTISSFELNGNIVLSSTVRDITEKKNSEEFIKKLAYNDHLTGLPNRLLFIDRLDQILLREAWKQKTVAVLFLDLDRFKIINDTLGHAFGDELLKVVARRLEDCLREGDTVARIGGDEFTVLLQDLAKAGDVPLVLNKILEAIKQPIEIDGQEVVIGTSIGASIFPDDGYDSDTLLKNADIAMYRAKSAGKSCFQLYSSAMSTKANNMLKVEHRLRKALEQGEFVMHYQPQLDLTSEALVGMEALIRLADKESGKLISPGEFIPVAEESGLIIPMSEWVFKTVCRQNKAWQTAGYPPVTVAVNASPRVFNQKNFVPMVVEILKETGLDPQYLEIEVTEETMMGNIEETIEKMEALRRIGVRFAIDDFGTGYSSLSYLKTLPIELLKIDRSFISDIFTNSDDKVIVSAIIQMAHNMGIEVLAEGVETEEQLAYLKSFDCDKLQGFLFSRPIPCDEVEKLLAKPECIKKELQDVV